MKRKSTGSVSMDTLGFKCQINILCDTELYVYKLFSPVSHHNWLNLYQNHKKLADIKKSSAELLYIAITFKLQHIEYLQDVYNWRNVVLQITTFKKQLVKTKYCFAF